MRHPHFFGYGSLVNRETHDYPNARRATAQGWRRAWVHTAERPYAYLSAVRAPNNSIDGLIAEVPGADWRALDAREHAYERIVDSENVHHDHPGRPEIAIYAVPPQAQEGVTDTHPILLSYVDVVLQGFLAEYGESGALGFVDSTDGWHAPVLDDRAAPIYPRHQSLSRREQSFVDSLLRDLGADVFKRD